MSYELTYYRTEEKIRLFLIFNIHKNICKNKIYLQIFYKIISKNNEFFNFDCLCCLINLPNKSTGYIDNKYTSNLKKYFINSIKLFLINNKFGMYLMKYYYTCFFILYTYNASIKYICKKIYIKSNKKFGRNKHLFYKDLNDINLILHKINDKFKFSYNDDNNYILINEIINDFLKKIKENNIIYFSKFNISYNNNIYIQLFKNIYDLNNSFN